MTIHRLKDLTTPVSEVLEVAGSDGVVLEAEGSAPYAVIPLDEDLIDYLIERSPKFIEDCRQNRQRMRAGEFQSHEKVKNLFAGE